uniref:Uncharacterized protein n=1 Tax=Mus spicilegus TaxID=10103 RepID=A0A8C6MTS0_MUSSI
MPGSKHLYLLSHSTRPLFPVYLKMLSPYIFLASHSLCNGPTCPGTHFVSKLASNSQRSSSFSLQSGCDFRVVLVGLDLLPPFLNYFTHSHNHLLDYILKQLFSTYGS